MEISKQRLRPDANKITTLLILFFIAFPVFLLIFMMHPNPLFDLNQGFPGVKVLWHSASNVTGLNVDIPRNGLLVPESDQEPGSGNDPLQPTSMANVLESPSSEPSSTSDAEQFNGPLTSTLGSGSNSKESRPNGIHVDKLIGEASEIGKGSVSRNNSFLPFSVTHDKLLNGLLAPGLDERSCLSRYRSFLYRKTLPHKPSAYLLSKLRKYEKLHTRCGPFTKSFNEALRSLQFNHVNSIIECKYIIWSGSNGIGNRMISMASTFLYALLTDRVLLVDHGTDMAGLFCEPFPNTSWLLPINFPLKKQISSLKVARAHSHESLVKNIIMNSSKEWPPSFVFLSTLHGDYSINQLFPCEQSQGRLQKVPWLILCSDQYFAPAFFLVPSLQQEMSKLFPREDTVFHHLGQYLFHPSNKVWEIITNFYQAHLTKVDERIGLQVRVFNARKTPFPLVMDQLLSCLLKKKLLPEVDTRKSAPTLLRKKSKVVLITSLSSWFYENLSSMYSTKPTVTGEIIGIYQPSHEEYQHRGDNVHNMKALAEIYLLSLSDVLVTSAWSTFGYVAQGLGGLKPWFLRKPAQNKIQDIPCQRDISMEPCFHYPPIYFCKEEAKVDVGAVVPYIKHCIDRKWGVKLISTH